MAAVVNPATSRDTAWSTPSRSAGSPRTPHCALSRQPVVSAADELRYQPSAAVERAVRLRDLTCRFPGCDRPAVVCDVDHTVPFNHADPRNGGLTVPWNLKCMCRQHHRLKTFHDGWRDEQLPDGTVIWTSPTGEIYRTVPGGVDLFPDRARSACREPKPFAATGLASKRPASRGSATATRFSGRSTRHTDDSNGPQGRRSPTAKTATGCARCCSSSKADPAPVPTAHGSTTRWNPKSCRPIGDLLLKHRSQTIRRSDLRYGEATAKRCHSPGTPLSS